MFRAGRLALVVLFVALAVRPADAQVPKQYVSLNPLGIVYTVYAGEFERAVAPAISVGASTSYWSDNDDDFSADFTYFSVDGKVRYYPSGIALQGFALGGALGFTSLGGNLVDDDGVDTDSGSAFSTGVVLDYTWLLGDRNNFVVGTGLGAKRLFLRGVQDTGGLVLAYPTVRVSVGYAW